MMLPDALGVVDILDVEIGFGKYKMPPF